MTSLRTTAEGYLLAIEADSTTFDDVTAWVDGLMAELGDPPGAVVEACCAGDDANKLMAELRQFPGELDFDGACRQMMFHMSNALAANPEFEASIVSKLHGFAVEHRDIPDAETSEFMRSLERELGQADADQAAALRARLGEVLRTFGVAPPKGA